MVGERVEERLGNWTEAGATQLTKGAITMPRETACYKWKYGICMLFENAVRNCVVFPLI